MKTTIVSVLISNAIEYVRKAKSAKKKSRPDEEVRNSIGAHLMIALAIEGIANEVGEAAFDKWHWSRIEKCDTPLKWYILFGFFGNKLLKQSEEPLQIIQKVTTIRNKIAHPKVIDLGDEIIIRSKKGKLNRNVPPDYILKNGDTIWSGLGKLVDEFNYKNTFEIVQKSFYAIKELRKQLSIEGLEWIDAMETKLDKVNG